MMRQNRSLERQSLMSDIDQLEQRLKIANERLAAAMKALAPKHKGDEWQEYQAASQGLLKLERQLANAKGGQFAETLEFPVRWDVGAPMPHLCVTDNKALLGFLLHEPDPNWDGSYTSIKGVSGDQQKPLALVEFDRCISAKLGAPNDEVWSGHPLKGKGQEAYRAQRVVNSHWLMDLQAINTVHRCYDPRSWRDLHHYIFWFHDSTFECVASSYRVETYRENMKSLLIRMAERLTS